MIIIGTKYYKDQEEEGRRKRWGQITKRPEQSLSLIQTFTVGSSLCVCL